MLDKTIDSALLNLRKQIIRGDGKGREHVEALLRMRGLDPASLPKIVVRSAPQLRRGETARLALLALANGPKRAAHVAAYVAAQTGLTQKQADDRMYQVLCRLQDKGKVQREGRMWGLAR